MIKTTIKVTFSGETKRVQAPGSYQELFSATQASFQIDHSQAVSFKFFLLDEDQELISISSQDDFADNVDYLQCDSQKAVPSLIYSDSATTAQNQLQHLVASRAPLSESTVSSKSRMMHALEKSLKYRVESKVEA